MRIFTLLFALLLCTSLGAAPARAHSLVPGNPVRSTCRW